METFAFALSVTGPIFLILILGTALGKVGLVNEAFIAGASRLIYLVTLPALLFINIFAADVPLGESLPLLAVGLIGTAITIPLAWLSARFCARGDRSVFIQGAFRGNLGIIGLAWVHNAYGSSGLAHGALLMAVITIFYNITAVALFTFYSQKTAFSGRKLLLDIAQNPLIVAIVLALLCKLVDLKLPAMVLHTGGYLASITLPLALLCIGANLDLGRLRHSSFAAFAATGFKLIIVPLVMLLVGGLFQLPGQSMAILFLLAATPSATVSFIMARALGGNSQLAANIIALSTLLSIVTASVGLVLFNAFLEIY